jgi:peptidoglycan/LPS O-acetylase OafA/YrhL
LNEPTTKICLEDSSALSGNSRKTPEPHLFTLDLLRAAAALAVVIYHWEHFSGAYLPANAGVNPPLHAVLKGLYAQGWQAVNLFFTLSGFVFYWLYSQPIADRRIRAGDFTLRRISRLYPLHFATLLAVAMIQPLVINYLGHPFVYDHNRPLTFAEHLLLVSAWIPGAPFSFNGPAWSISVEVFLYALFFVVCSLRWTTWRHALLLSAFGLIGERLGMQPLSDGIIGFFLGGFAFHLYARLRERATPAQLNLLLLAAIAAWFLVPYLVRNRFFYDSVREALGGRWNVAGKDLIGFFLLSASSYVYTLVLFPFTILALALNDARWRHASARFAFLGNLSYSIYLLHFPLQLVFLLIVLKKGFPTTVLLSPLGLATFLVVLLAVSFASYYRFERPLQRYLRGRLIPPP